MSGIEGLRIDRSAAAEPSPSRRWIWIGSGVAVLIALLAFWLAGSRPPVVRTAVVAEASGPAGPGTVLNASGYVTARRRATISAKVTGRVSEVFVEEGLAVKQGDILARLDDSQAKKALRETEIQLADAETRLRRARALRRQGIASQADLDTVQAQTDGLAARLEMQRQDLAETVIRAPFAGIAISKDAQPGEIVSPMSAGGGFTRTGICTLVDMNSLEIEVDVNEAFIGRVTPAQKVEAVLDAYPEWRIPAHVITTIPAADRQKATVKVRIGFDQHDPRVLPDMGVKVAFLSSEPQAGATAKRPALVPRAALRGAAGQEFVLVVREGRLERRAVRVSDSTGDPAQILSGVSPGEEVVIEGAAELRDGDRVRVEKGRS